jgi:hypothetical protein
MQMFSCSLFSLQSARLLGTASSDEAKLHALGYKQELKRELTYFHNFAMSFSVVSILTGLTGEVSRIRLACDMRQS